MPGSPGAHRTQPFLWSWVQQAAARPTAQVGTLKSGPLGPRGQWSGPFLLSLGRPGPASRSPAPGLMKEAAHPFPKHGGAPPVFLLLDISLRPWTPWLEPLSGAGPCPPHCPLAACPPPGGSSWKVSASPLSPASTRTSASSARLPAAATNSGVTDPAPAQGTGGTRGGPDARTCLEPAGCSCMQAEPGSSEGRRLWASTLPTGPGPHVHR